MITPASPRSNEEFKTHCHILVYLLGQYNRAVQHDDWELAAYYFNGWRKYDAYLRGVNLF